MNSYATGGSAGPMMSQAERVALVSELRKNFSAFLKAKSCKNPAQQNQTEQGTQQLLDHFSKVMSHFTPDELCSQFKEHLAFITFVAQELVHEIRRRASSENTQEAALAVYMFIRAHPSDSRGWMLLKTIIFISNSGSQKVLECFCKTMLPTTLIKVAYLFMDLPDSENVEEQSIRRRLNDSLVMLIMNLCSTPLVAEELIQKDDLLLLFIGASSRSASVQNIWRNAIFSFLCSLVAKALTPPVLKYIIAKKCIGQYLANISKAEEDEQVLLLCNLLDLLRGSAESTQELVEDFETAKGFTLIVDCCVNGSTNNADQLLSALTGLISAGDRTVRFKIPQNKATAQFHSQQMVDTVARSTGTIRCVAAFKALEHCFIEGNDQLCLLALDKILQLFRAERMNYFIVDEQFSLFIIVEGMMAKGIPVQDKLLELVELVLRTLDHVPYKELSSLNSQLKNAVVQSKQFGTADRLLRFFLRIISVNGTLRDAYRELLILDTFLHIVQCFSAELAAQSEPENSSQVLQLALDLLISAIKGNPLNAQFIIENMDANMAKMLLLMQPESQITQQQKEQELGTSIGTLFKQLLYLARNELLFSSMLQLLFSEPAHTRLCAIILELFSCVLLESHKVRVVFRRSGGYICLMTLLLHMERSLATSEQEENGQVADWHTSRRHIALIFQVLAVSMRYEPNNAKYFRNEVRPSIINSILLNLGCFTQCSKMDIADPVWEQAAPAKNADKLATIHHYFSSKIMPESHIQPIDAPEPGQQEIPVDTANALFVMRMLMDLALDNVKRPSSSSIGQLHWANPDEWLRNAENIETVPVLSDAPILVHPSAAMSMLCLLPAIGSHRHPSSAAIGSHRHPSSVAKDDNNGQTLLDPWAALAQLYIALLLKAILRLERNQQTMCQLDMPAKLLEIGQELFTMEAHHPLLSSFHYLFERLAYQHLQSADLRHFLRLDKPLCCKNIDDDDDDGDQNGVKAGGPVPTNRIKSFVSMLTPRHHDSVQSPAFVEFDLAIEGFAALVIPSLAGGHRLGQQSQQQQQQQPGEPMFCSPSTSSGFTLTMWINLAGSPLSSSSPSSDQHPSTASTLCLFSIVRADPPSSVANNIENHTNCFQVLLQQVDCCWTLVISGADHSVADELAKGFRRPAERCVRVPLSEQYFPARQWVHLAIVFGRPCVPKSGGLHPVEVFINGRSLSANQKLQICWHSADATGADAGILNAYIGTLPLFRRPTGEGQLRWRLASLYLVEQALSAEVLRKMHALGVAYTGNLQSPVLDATSTAHHCPLVAEDKIVLSLNGCAASETTAQALRALHGADADLIAHLVGISPSDQATPLCVLWNMAPQRGNHHPPFGAVLIGYLGIRRFAPCPVSALLDSIGGVSPLFALVAMSHDYSGLYASLKVLVCAVRTNPAIFAEMQRIRGFQTLSILLEDKAPQMNSHILHLILTLAGTVDDGRLEEPLLIPNLQIFEDLLCDLDVWRGASQDVWKLLLEHFLELLTDASTPHNLTTIRQSSLLARLLVYLNDHHHNRRAMPFFFPVRNDLPFRLIAAIMQPPCDPNSLLRFGQTIAATIAFDVDESGYPFHIAELERMLLQRAEADEQGKSDDIEDDGSAHLYAVYVRNRLLNILCTMLSHSNARLNNQLSTLIVNSLGFGWIFAFCGPRIHPGTLFLAMRILANLLRYPPLVKKFCDGSANGGWLSDADSVIRNRAAVLLGFSVANQAGAVGAHVDLDPELARCSGFASLEHVAFAHADKPFVLLTLFTVLFQQQHNANIQPLEEFTIDVVWSHVFGLDEQGSVAEVIQGAQPFCADIIVSLVATIRAGIHQLYQIGATNNSSKHSWASNYPLRLLQLFTFLYQNSSQFFAICHTEAFFVILFTSLFPPAPDSPKTPTDNSSVSVGSNDTMEASSSEAGEEDGSELRRCVKQCVDLLTNILLDDLCLDTNETGRTEPLLDSLIEYLDSNGPTQNRQNRLFTELINACLDQFMSGKMFFRNGVSASVPESPSSSANVVRFLSRIIDTVWNCTYKGNPVRILKCFLKLLAEAHASNKAAAPLQCTDAHIGSLFRLVLYLLSRPIDNVDTQMSVLDTLAEIVRNQQLFVTPRTNVDPLFYAALVHLIFMLSDRPQFDLQDRRNRELERGTAQVSICAQSVWGILWQHKKTVLEEWLRKGELDLDLFTARAKCGEAANRAWLQFVDSQTVGTPTTTTSTRIRKQDSSSSSASAVGGRSLMAMKTQKMLPGQLQTRLSQVARSGIVQRLRKSASSAMDSSASSADQKQEWLGSLMRFDDERLRVQPETFYMWIRVHISLVRELVRTQCQRYHEWHNHVRKWCLQEWHNAETELIRERGLWGPDRGSTALDKFQLDVSEGPGRIRRKLVPNPHFYRNYPYRPNLELPEAKPLRAKVAISRDSKPYWEHMCRNRADTMDERIVDFQAGLVPSPISGGSGTGAQAPLDPSAEELSISMIRRIVEKNLELRESEVETTRNAVDEHLEEQEHEEEADEEEEEEAEAEEDEAEENGEAETAIGDEQQSFGGANEEEVQQGPAKDIDDKEDPGKRQQKKQTEESRRRHRRRDHSVTGEAASQGPDNQTLLRLLEQGEQLHSMFRCARVQGLDTTEGLLLFGKHHFYVVDGYTLLKTREIRDLDFLPEQFHDPIIPYIAMGCRSRPQSTKVNRQCNKFAYEHIREVHKRRYLLQQIALEVFSADGRNFLLAFPRKVRDRVYQKLLSMAKSASSDVAQFLSDQKRLRPRDDDFGASSRLLMAAGSRAWLSMDQSSLSSSSSSSSSSIRDQWVRGQISNFHYLMCLNTLAGRSYNDLSQYPVFPWVLADYHSPELDLTRPDTFRDLSKPMGAQSPERLAQFLKRYHEWDDPGGTPPYMYGTHYSSAMIVLSYLVRLEPFTQHFLKLQGGHFDLADRMFHSVHDAYWSSARNNMADVKELIPEWFYLPEMFRNENRFDLGAKQSGVRLDDVELPSWARGDAQEFVRLHRQALESDYVSEHLHEWIDLVFGYKQTGDAAREANNVFHHLFYEAGIDIETIEDPLTRNATLGFINNFGQVPAQLFKKPHPQRKMPQGQQSQQQQQPLVSVVPGVTVPPLFYHAPEALRVSPRPVKELRAAVGDIVIVGDKANQVLVLEQNKVLVPPRSFLAWAFHDRSIRFGAVGHEKSTCVLETNLAYELTCMATTDGCQVFAGLSTGTVFVWSLSPLSSCASCHCSNTVRLVPKKALGGHSDVVTALAASAPHTVLISGSRDRTVIVWHLTRLSFIRQLAAHPGPISAVQVNEAKGDIGTASGAWLYVWTINGVPLAAINTADSGGLFSNVSSLVLCIAFSTANDWDENNVVLCGTSDGLVKMYSLDRAASKDSSTINSRDADPEGHNQQAERSAVVAGGPEQPIQAVKQHLLRRQERIQQHNKGRLLHHGAGESIQSPRASPFISRDPSFSRQQTTTMMAASSSSTSSNSNDNPSQQPRPAAVMPEGMEMLQWHSTLRLRRVLSEHTAFSAGNPQPAPITALRPTRDHRSLLVGDGIGRIWMWTIAGGESTDAS